MALVVSHNNHKRKRHFKIYAGKKKDSDKCIYSFQHEKSPLYISLPYVATNKEFLFEISPKDVCHMESCPPFLGCL